MIAGRAPVALLAGSRLGGPVVRRGGQNGTKRDSLLSPAIHAAATISRRLWQLPATKRTNNVAKNWDPRRGDRMEPMALQRVSRRGRPRAADKMPKPSSARRECRAKSRSQATKPGNKRSGHPGSRWSQTWCSVVRCGIGGARGGKRGPSSAEKARVQSRGSRVKGRESRARIVERREGRDRLSSLPSPQWPFFAPYLPHAV
jgi:hypothetical protein